VNVIALNPASVLLHFLIRFLFDPLSGLKNHGAEEVSSSAQE